MAGLGANDVAEMLGWPRSRVYGFVRDGVVKPRREGRAYVFDFRDLVVLRSAQDLMKRQLSPSQVRHALKELRTRMPAGRSLSAARLLAHGRAVTVQESGTSWELESGQGTLDFLNPTSDEIPADEPAQTVDPADEWFDIGVRLEESDPNRAAYAYGRAIEMRTDHVDALCNLGRMLQDVGRLDEAVDHYVRALGIDANHAVARFNLGTTLEDLGQFDEALDCYALAAPELADARYNRARLLEQLGRQREALAELKLLLAQRRP